MQILNRAKSIYSDEYFISEDIKFELDLMYLRINGKWRECDKLTRSINFEDMLDNQGNKIFASLQKDGKGGDICYVEDVSYGKLEGVAKYQNHSFRIDRKGKSMGVSLQCSDLKVIGIQG